MRFLPLLALPLIAACATPTKTSEPRAVKTPRAASRPAPRPASQPKARETPASPEIAALPGEEGIASYYSDRLAGRLTANGERYHPERATCAHKTLPFGTHVRVIDLETGDEVRCRINDRGPFVKGRVIDLSKRLARELGMLDRGLARVKVVVEARDGEG